MAPTRGLRRGRDEQLGQSGLSGEDLGRLKVEATAELCRKVNSGIEIIPVPQRFRRSMEIGNAAFCCVDSIDIRRLIWEAVKDRVSFFGDARMSAEVLRVLTACDAGSQRHYPTTLFRTEEAFVGPCTAKTTIYCANIAAGLMIAQFAKHLRQLPIEPDLQLNLLASELSVADACL
jgi:sulfur carrier protein ThiS adenylyltransferase